MRFALASIMALAVSVMAEDAPTVPFDPIYTPSNMQEVQVGEPFKITWDAQPAIYDNEPVIITLIGGPTQGTQVPLYVVTTGILNKAKEFVWTPLESEYGKDWYGLSIAVLSNPTIQQYSNPFRVVNKKAVTTTATGTTTTTATTHGTTTATGTSSVHHRTSSVPHHTTTKTRGGNPVVTNTVDVTTCLEDDVPATPVYDDEEPCDDDEDDYEGPWTGGDKPVVTPAPAPGSGDWKPTNPDTPQVPGTPYTPGNGHKGNSTTLVPVPTGGNRPSTTFVPSGAAAQGVPMVALAAAAIFVFAF